VHEETRFVLDSLYDRKPMQIMQLPKCRSYMIAWFQVEHDSLAAACSVAARRRICTTYIILVHWEMMRVHTA